MSTLVLLLHVQHSPIGDITGPPTHHNYTRRYGRQEINNNKNNSGCIHTLLHHLFKELQAHGVRVDQSLHRTQ